MSGEGASACGSCGRPLAPAAPPGYGPQPPYGHGQGHGQGQGYAHAHGQGYGQGYGYGGGPPAPPAVGSWGAGTPYAPQSSVRRLLTWADWLPAVKAAVAPTVVLLLAALIAATADGYQDEYQVGSSDFGDRFGVTLSITLNALGAPFRLGYQSTLSRGDTERMDIVIRVAPMTVTVLWCLALWVGLRAGLRRRKAVEGQLTRGRAAGEGLRTAVVLAVVTTLLWAVGGTSRQLRDSYDVSDDAVGRDLPRPTVTADAGWLEAVGWTLLLAGLLAFLVYGTDALRWAAWRSRSVRGWAVAALAAGRAMAVSVALASVVAFVLVAVNSTSGGQIALSLAFLPNLGLLLLGFGSGATFQVRSGRFGDGTFWGTRGDDLDLSYFDLHDRVTADWRWAGLLALLAAGTLGWTAYRRQLDAADRLRLAAVHAAALTALTAVAGSVLTRTSSATGMGLTSDLEVSRETSVGLTFLTLLVANAVWAVVGALLVPSLLVAVRGGGAGAGHPAGPYAAAPYGTPPYGTPPYGGVPYGGAPRGAVPPPYPSAPPVPQGSSYGPPPPGVPTQGVPGQGVPGSGVPGYGVPPQPAAPQDGPLAPGSGVSEVLGSHEAPIAPAAGTPAGAAEVPPPRAEEPVDPSVWREHP
ncbi:proline-rich domain-containing protein [Kitasatospora sp. NPDC086791]|uniref:proline-rich domain-containing protein n=1 Tax=Kitasatospora sp. NPDC086791 TaxID=3155178 RepID=UPI00344939EC